MAALRRAVVLAFVVLGCSSGGDPAKTAWWLDLIASRTAKDNFLRGDASPLPLEARSQFAGLAYFDPDPHFRVDATFTPAAGADTVWVTTSAATREAYLRHGTCDFKLDGRALHLACYRSPESGALFVPFTDATSNHTTYGGGRYLDVVIPATGPVQLDFNRAYNPYCAYAPGWVCPLPPAENHLAVEIRAGEKSPHGH